MKNTLSAVILYLNFVFFLFYSCRSATSSDALEEFIPGTYTRSSQHEFGSEYDTLVISIQNRKAGQYKIERRWKYERIVDGNPIEPEYKILQTSGIYHDQKKLLQESETGDSYSFDPEKNLLFIGATQYKKIRL